MYKTRSQPYICYQVDIRAESTLLSAGALEDQAAAGARLQMKTVQLHDGLTLAVEGKDQLQLQVLDSDLTSRPAPWQFEDPAALDNV